ncbi:hypothetical protein IFM89_027716 [Coptis chinensis]|uniref:Uncharacterized protein n=1 Tax=Coptis chinensis TaxID=261450 RepID=A0A835HYW0_9MAGN|nr:hypothetical protein IFM89_027716 [Coptis chinensis]
MSVGHTENSREPCPDRILDDLGGAFSMGCVGGSVFHFIKGAKNSPLGDRLSGGFQTARMSAPLTATGGFLQMRQGLKVSGKSAVVGGVLLALIEGAGIALNMLFAPNPQNMPIENNPYQTMPMSKETVLRAGPVEKEKAGWFGAGGMFGRKKKEEKEGGEKKYEEVFDSFDTPAATMPSFDYK